jgi:hypothetical protein
MFLGKVSEVQNIDQLGKVVNEARESGVRFNFPVRFSQGREVYNFTDHVIKKISELGKNPKVSRGIICKLN